MLGYRTGANNLRIRCQRHYMPPTVSAAKFLFRGFLHSLDYRDLVPKMRRNDTFGTQAAHGWGAGTGTGAGAGAAGTGAGTGAGAAGAMGTASTGFGAGIVPKGMNITIVSGRITLR